jgi:hypothetical protein
MIQQRHIGVHSLTTLILATALAFSHFHFKDRADNIGAQSRSPRLDINDTRFELTSIGRLSDFNTIAQRPLFIEARREQEAPKVVRKAITPVIQNLRVKALGHAVSGNQLLAVIKDLSNGKTLRMRIDENIQGWTLTAVNNSSFTFRKGQAEQVITFRDTEG